MINTSQLKRAHKSEFREPLAWIAQTGAAEGTCAGGITFSTFISREPDATGQ
jgi:hypothetical protein